MDVITTTRVLAHSITRPNYFWLCHKLSYFVFINEDRYQEFFGLIALLLGCFIQTEGATLDILSSR